jgi:hypothetical protein
MMPRWPTIVIASFLTLGLLIVPASRSALAQFADAAADTATAAGDAEGDQASTLLTAEELNVLVAPVALYPDELLAVVLPASTNPLQIVEAQRFLEKQKSDPDLKPDESWDPSVLALLNYPEVIKQMNDDLSWTQDLGNAVLDQQADVLNAIQAARASASDAGYLQSNDQQTVINEGDNITIESSDPDVVYVPSYDPAPIVNNTYVNYPPPVYSQPYAPYWYPAATFFTGAFVGAAFAYGFDWDDDDIDIDNDIDIDRGDINIGSGNTIDRTDIDRTKLENRFNGERKAGADGKMKWSPQKAREKSSIARKTPAAQRPTSASLQRQLSGGSRTGAQNKIKSHKAARTQSQRGHASLSETKKSKQQLRQSASKKQMQRHTQQQRAQKHVQPRQLKQKQGGGGAFANAQSHQRVKAQSNRGHHSLNRSGGGRPPRVSRR